MSDSTQKGTLSAYQRWEMASFDTPRSAPEDSAFVSQNSTNLLNKQKEELEKQALEKLILERLQAEKLENEQRIAEQAAAVAEAERQRAYDQAYEDAYQKAYQEGYQAGMELGKQEGLDQGKQESDQQLLHLQEILSQLSTQISTANEDIGNDLLNLSVELAQAMTQSTLELHPESIAGIVKNAIEQLPAMQLPVQVFLHPDDALLIKAHLNEEIEKNDWRIVSDHQLQRGDCRLETSHNIIDASLATRWDGLSRVLQKNLP